ncbi:MAG: RNA-binding S4 domain-containing protein [Deltaproteobacteria bacterium]|nr:RNA-binding S4 domain-containing protein [Deltaproteobacteria bacterium]
MPKIEIRIRDQSIRLGQFLKLSQAVSSGGEAKIRIRAGEVEVNGKVDTRRGAQLHQGDIVEIAGQRFVIATA